MNQARSPAVAALQSLVSASVACVARVDPVGVEVLDPVEAAFLRTAAAARRIADFRTGRDCARLALGQLGLSARAIPVGPDREPLWPDCVVGSITHCAGFYAAAVARTTDLRAIGIDAERSEAVDRSLESLILSPAERDGLDRWNEETRDPLRAAVFSIKESVFKCLFPLTGRFLEFHDVEVRISAPLTAMAGPRPAMTRGARDGFMQGESVGSQPGTIQDFVAVITDSVDILDCLRHISGRYCHCDGFVLSVAELPA